MKTFIELFKEQNFSKGSKIADLQEQAKAGKQLNENAIATACLKTKPYKQGGEFTDAVNAILNPVKENPKAEKAETPKLRSSREAEPRGW